MTCSNGGPIFCQTNKCAEHGCFRRRLADEIARGERWASDALRTENLPDRPK